ncbi:MAG: hypothetical protein ACKOI2_09445 [Actinomycetota bacterium]
MTTPGGWDLQPNDVTTRAELAKFGGNQQAGIAHSATTPNIMIFSDPGSPNSAGYHFDGWDGDVFRYTGEGKYGDQEMTDGNKAIRDHIADGRALRVFVADGTLAGKKTKLQRYLGEFALDADKPYDVKRDRDLDGNMRDVYVFNMRPVGDVIRRTQEANPFSGVNEVAPVGVHAVPTEANEKSEYEYQQAGTKKAQRLEAQLSDRFERYLVDVHKHKVTRYRIVTAGSSGSHYTDLADETARVLYEAKGVTNRMSVRLALGQILDYARYVQKDYPGTVLSLLLPQSPPGDMIELLKAFDIGCVVERGPDVYVDETGLGRCP